MIRILEDKDAQSLMERKAVRLEEAERVVAPILADVREARGLSDRLSESEQKTERQDL